MTKKEYKVYMLTTSRRNIYAGITKDIGRRLHEHNHTKRGAKSLRGQRPVCLSWESDWMTHSAALKMELDLKSLSHSHKKNLIKISYDIKSCLFEKEIEDTAYDLIEDLKQAIGTWRYKDLDYSVGAQECIEKCADEVLEILNEYEKIGK